MRHFGPPLLIVALVGCGDNLAAPVDAGADAQPDAAPVFAEAPHDPPPQVRSGGGPVLTAPKVVPIFFATDATVQAQTEQFLTALAASPYWATTTGEYGVGGLTIAPSIVTTDAPPTTDALLRTWLTASTDGTHAGWPVPDPNTLYVVFLPAGVVLTAGTEKSCVAFGGYHDEVMTAGSPSIVYALIPRCGNAGAFSALDLVTIATSHELVEAATDPFVTSAPAWVRLDPDHYVWGRTPGGELGDMCEYVTAANQKLVGDFLVQRTWSNASAANGHDPCVPLPPGAFAGAAAHMPEDVTLTTHGGTMTTTKAITVNYNETKTLDVVMYSDAPTADWSLDVEDVATLQQTTPTLQFQWDNQLGNNGRTRHLMITRTVKGTTARGSELAIMTKVNGVMVSMSFGFVAGQ